MLTRPLASLALLALAAAPLMAQQPGAHHDPDVSAGGGALPAGWSGRTDRAESKLSDAKFVAMGSGHHVTSGPAAIYWSDKDAVTGPYTATATFRQTTKPSHPEGYGLFVMGKRLTGPDVSYAYFLVRGDGKFLVNHRAGSDVHKIIEWTESAAVHKEDARGSATNTLTVDASRPDSLRLLVNGTQVAAIEGSHLGSMDGQVGLRVNHNLDVHVSALSVAPVKR